MQGRKQEWTAQNVFKRKIHDRNKKKEVLTVKYKSFNRS